jgi:hypothetical protein
MKKLIAPFIGIVVIVLLAIGLKKSAVSLQNLDLFDVEEEDV